MHLIFDIQALLLRMERPDIKKRTAELAEQYKGNPNILEHDMLTRLAQATTSLALSKLVIVAPDSRGKYCHIAVACHGTHAAAAAAAAA
eukprot:6326783-Amphidinium_carterae.1